MRTIIMSCTHTCAKRLALKMPVLRPCRFRVFHLRGRSGVRSFRVYCWFRRRFCRVECWVYGRGRRGLESFSGPGAVVRLTPLDGSRREWFGCVWPDGTLHRLQDRQ